MEENRNVGSWSNDMLLLAMENTVDQWMEKFTRHKGEEEPSVLYFMFPMKPETHPIIKYLSTMGKIIMC